MDILQVVADALDLVLWETPYEEKLAYPDETKLYFAIHDPTAIDDILGHPKLGIGESYMKQKWSCNNLYELLRRVIIKQDEVMAALMTVSAMSKVLWWKVSSMIWNRQTIEHSTQNVSEHYNTGNDLYKEMLDPWMQYTCAMWTPETKNLQEAQLNKLHMIGEKLQLKPGMKVIDIGCGWGYLAHYLATVYDVEMVGVTISEEQQKEAMSHGWKNVDIRLQDYRLIPEAENGTYDRVVSIGCIEHIGPVNFTTFFGKINDLMKPNGIALVHGILNGCQKKEPLQCMDWLDKYIFPGAIIPTVFQVINASHDFFLCHDYHEFGLSYEKTCNAWKERYLASFPRLDEKFKTEEFKRMWLFYLDFCRAGFNTKNSLLGQFVFAKRFSNLEQFDSARSFQFDSNRPEKATIMPQI